jgi:hypothetical protein
MRFPPLLGLLASLVVFSFIDCDHSSSVSVTPSGSVTVLPPASAVSASATRNAVPTEGLGDPPRLPDADLDTLASGLKCTRADEAKPGPCKVIAAMQKCAEWKGVPPSGDGRFIGHGWQVAGSGTTDVVTLLRTRKVLQTEVEPWQLPIKIALFCIDKAGGQALGPADATIAALARSDGAAATNATLDYVKRKTDWTDDAPAAETMGSMVETFSEQPTYICLGEGRQIELVQQASANIGLKPDGLYAELWPVTW